MSAAVSVLSEGYAERVYAGVLGKLIGVSLGRPVEGWPYAAIRDRFGLVDRFVAPDLGLPIVVADDDISGAFTFGRVLEDLDDPAAVSAADVGNTWLNYVIEDRTILWWGGYGRSTEHTAYLNLCRGIPAPQSGSAAQNGTTLAEQIGAQIFSDVFALAHPGDVAEAVRVTRAAASVSHDGVALDAASFFAAMRAAAFVESDLERLVDAGRRWIADSRLAHLVDDVVMHVRESDDWQTTRDWLDDRYGYARYPGPCHALANTAVVIAALRLGGDDFARAVAVASSVGFDTDSNAGTVGCLNGIRLGLSGIPWRLREPVQDRAVVVSADGGECVTDAVRESDRIVGAARRIAGVAALPRRDRYTFHYPGATQGWALCPAVGQRTEPADCAGSRSRPALRWDDSALILAVGDTPLAVSTPTFLDPTETSDNFVTIGSPTLYPTTTVRFRLSAKTDAPSDPVAVSAAADPVVVTPYVVFATAGGPDVVTGQPVPVQGMAVTAWEVPARGNQVPYRLGIRATATRPASLRIHAVGWEGAPRAFAQEGLLQSSIWDTAPVALRPWVSSAATFEADFAATYAVSHPGMLGVVTTGTRDWRNYAITATLTLSLHETAGLVVRSRGHRSFTAGIFHSGGIELCDQVNDTRTVLARTTFPTERDRAYRVTLSVVGSKLSLFIDGTCLLAATTARALGGGAGFLVERGTMTADGVLVEAHDPHNRVDPTEQPHPD